MKETSKFQFIFLTVFVVAVVVAVFALALFRSKGTGPQSYRSISIWGTVSESDFDSFLRVGTNDKSINAKYVQKNSETLYQDLLEAIAAGGAPDVLFVNQQQIYALRSKIATIPFTAYSERTFKDSFIEGTELFLNTKGVTALPALSDPLVMYWNRDLYNAAGIAKPPTTWDEFYTLSGQISQHNNQLQIIRSAVALGEFSNINNAKQILANLIYQSGGSVTKEGVDNFGPTGLTSGLKVATNAPENPVITAFNFFMQFSDPLKPTYSWNRTLSSSKDMFIAGDLATYFGHASEINEIRAKNPNLNFDVAFIPQNSASNAPAQTQGDFYVFALVNSSKLQDGIALSDINILTKADAIARVASSTAFLPVRRDLLSVPQGKADKTVFYKSAFYTRSWIDPDPKQTDTIFSEMVTMISSGRLTISETIDRADAQLKALLK